jgi:hypothetical protein
MRIEYHKVRMEAAAEAIIVSSHTNRIEYNATQWDHFKRHRDRLVALGYLFRNTYQFDGGFHVDFRWLPKTGGGVWPEMQPLPYLEQAADQRSQWEVWDRADRLEDWEQLYAEVGLKAVAKRKAAASKRLTDYLKEKGKNNVPLEK